MAGEAAFLTGLFFTGETPFIGDALFPLEGDLAGAAFTVFGCFLTREVSGRDGMPNFSGDSDDSFATKVLNPSVVLLAGVFSWILDSTAAAIFPLSLLRVLPRHSSSTGAATFSTLEAAFGFSCFLMVDLERDDGSLLG